MTEINTTTVMTISMPIETRKKLEIFVKEHNMAKSRLAVCALEEYMDNFDKNQLKKLKKATDKILAKKEIITEEMVVNSK